MHYCSKGPGPPGFINGMDSVLINFFIHGSKRNKINAKGVFEEIGFRIWQLKEMWAVLKADQMLPTQIWVYLITFFFLCKINGKGGLFCRFDDFVVVRNVDSKLKTDEMKPTRRSQFTSFFFLFLPSQGPTLLSIWTYFGQYSTI